ncbi:MAG TPA: hypothetical protein PK867_15040 [Pirellulales bacterium]|nr:hypothetical protein [Pirellulales bacterium]
MPKPVYIVCAESAVEDKLTSKHSVFNIIEKVMAFKREEDQPLTTFSCVVSAVWRREPRDDCDFETEFAVLLPKSGERHSIAQQEFKFPPGNQMARFNLLFNGPPPVDGGGVLEFLHCIRKKGTNEWSTQSYPVFVEEVKSGQPQNAVARA